MAFIYDSQRNAGTRRAGFMSEQIIIPTPGDVVAGKYRIERELGRGAHGVVFLATQEGIERKVAIKTLLPKAFFEEGIVERFEREAKFVGRLNHPNIVRVHDYGQHDKLLYMAVEYVDGQSLEELIEGPRPHSTRSESGTSSIRCWTR